MPTDNRISTLPEINLLYSDVDLLEPLTGDNANADADVLFLLTKSGAKNERITFKNLKNSLLGNTVSLTGNQIISGEKTFADICTFEQTVFLNEVVDTTIEGDISGYHFVAETGRFGKLGIGTGFQNKSRDPEYDLHVEGDVFIEGSFTTLGGLELGGDLQLNDVIVGGNLLTKGSGIFESGIDVNGDANISGSLSVLGSGTISGDLNISGDMMVASKISSLEHPNTFVEFGQDSLTLQADTSKISINEQEIEMVVSGDKKFFIDDLGRLSINNDSPTGDFSMSGEAYIEELYITGQDGEWERLVPKGYDESVNFSTDLISGRTDQLISFPKTFGSAPRVSATLEADNPESILYFNISNVTRSSYRVDFNTSIPNNTYSIQTKAVASEEYSVHETSSQSFRHQIIEGDTQYEIAYPNPFNLEPVISVSLERKSSFSINDEGTAGDTFIDGWEYYIATDTNTWRRITTSEIIRDAGNTGDTDFDNDFYYICIDGTLWGKIPLVESTKSDPGNLGDVQYDNDYIYVLTAEGWKEAPIATWISESSAQIIPYMISDITTTSFKINFAAPLGSQYFVHIIASR